MQTRSGELPFSESLKSITETDNLSGAISLMIIAMLYIAFRAFSICLFQAIAFFVTRREVVKERVANRDRQVRIRITMACNEKWPEILANLRRNQEPID